MDWALFSVLDVLFSFWESLFLVLKIVLGARGNLEQMEPDLHGHLNLCSMLKEEMNKCLLRFEVGIN